MKKRMMSLCAILAAISLVGCGETSDLTDRSSSETVEAVTTSTDQLTTEKTVPETTVPPSESTTESTSAAKTDTSTTENAVKQSETTAVTENTSGGEMDGTGGDIENEMYKLEGFWESTDREQLLHFENNTFTLTRNGSTSSGYLTHADADPANRFALTEDMAGTPDGRYVQSGTDRFASLVFTENGSDTEFIFAGALVPSIISMERGTFTYNGIQYTDPVTIELTAREDISDVRLLWIEPMGVDVNNAPVFDRETVLVLPSLEKGSSFTPIVEIPGSIPAYGISYVDTHGNVHGFSIGLSGMDGSVLLTPFKLL